MKNLYYVLIFLIVSVSAMAQTRKVAILETVDRENALNYGIKLMVSSHLAEAVTNTPGYEAYDRTNLEQIFDEQEFQRTGFVSDDDIKKIGEMTGVQYVLVAEASKLDEHNLFITAKILNVETARVEKTANTMTQTDIPSLQKGAQDLASRLLAAIKKSDTSKIISSTNGNAYIERIGTYEYLIDGQYVKRKGYYKFINNRVCPQAYNQFQFGRKLCISGWCLFGVGAAVTAVGCVSLEALIIGPCVMVGAGVPLISVGYYKKDNAYKKYNEYCAQKDKKPTLTLSLQSSSNGLGLALAF